MKKILLILCFFPICLNAKKNWDNTLPLNKDIRIIETELRYKWYKIEEKNVSYKKEEECICEYLDKSNYIYGDYIYIEDFDPLNAEIEIEKYEKIFDENQFKYISFTNFSLASEEKVYEILIRSKKSKEKIKYNIIKYENINGNEEELNDFNYFNGPLLNENSYFLLEFDTEYNSNDIEIVLYLTNPYIPFTFDMNFMLEEEFIVKYNNINTGYYCPASAYCIVEIFPNNEWNTKNKFEIEKYKYKEKQYKCYDIQKNYLEEYYNQKEGYIKDETTSSLYYAYELVQPIIKEKVITKTLTLIEKEDLNNTNIEENKIIEEDTIGVINDKIALKDIKNQKEKKSQGIFLLIFISINAVFGLIYLLCRKRKELG